MALPKKDKVIYGVGAFGYGSVNQMFGNYLMFFGTGVLGLSGTLMGLAVSISTVWDAITDPIVGTMSDNHKGRFLGKRHSFMLVGCICVAIINIIIWSIDPTWSSSAKFLVLLMALLAVETFNTVYATPYAALGIDMGKTYDERTSIQVYKTCFQFLALLVPSVLMAMFFTSANGYIIIAVITSSLCIITGFAAIVGTRRYREKNISGERGGSGANDTAHPRACIAIQSKPPMNFKNIFAAFFGILKDRNTRFLVLAYAISLSCNAFITTLGMHIFTYTFYFSSLQVPIVMFCLVAGIIAGQPIWYKISRKIDKKNTVLSALALVIFGALAFSFILAFRSYIDPYLLVALVSVNIFIISCGMGCMYSLPISMFADCIYKGKEERAEDNTAAATGFLTFCTKITNASVLMMVGIVLDVIGFRGGLAVQEPFVRSALGWALVMGVIAASVVAWHFYSKYQYKKDDFK